MRCTCCIRYICRVGQYKAYFVCETSKITSSDVKRKRMFRVGIIKAIAILKIDLILLDKMVHFTHAANRHSG